MIMKKNRISGLDTLFKKFKKDTVIISLQKETITIYTDGSVRRVKNRNSKITF